MANAMAKVRKLHVFSRRILRKAYRIKAPPNLHRQDIVFRPYKKHPASDIKHRYKNRDKRGKIRIDRPNGDKDNRFLSASGSRFEPEFLNKKPYAVQDVFQSRNFRNNRKPRDKRLPSCPPEERTYSDNANRVHSFHYKKACRAPCGMLRQRHKDRESRLIDCTSKEAWRKDKTKSEAFSFEFMTTALVQNGKSLFI